MDTASAQDPSQLPVCHWKKLSIELKLHIFSYLNLVESKPILIQGGTAPEYIKDLYLVNKEFKFLTQDIWYKNNVFILDWSSFTDLNYKGSLIMRYPHAYVSHLVRTLELRLDCSAFPYDYEGSTLEATEWRLLLRPQLPSSTVDTALLRHQTPGPQGSSSDRRATRWQDKFSNLDKLVIKLYHLGWLEDQDCMVHHAKEGPPYISKVKDMISKSEIAITAKQVEVEVECFCFCWDRSVNLSGFESFHCRPRRLGFLEEMIQEKITKREG